LQSINFANLQPFFRFAGGCSGRERDGKIALRRPKSISLFQHMPEGQDSTMPPVGASGGGTTPTPPQSNLTPPAHEVESYEQAAYRKIKSFGKKHPIWSAIITYFFADFVLKKISESFSWAEWGLVKSLTDRMPHFQVNPEISWITGPIGAFLIYRIYRNISPDRRFRFGSIRPFLVVIGTFCFFSPFVQLPRLVDAPPHFHLGFLTTMNNRRSQFVFLTNACLEQRGTNGPFSQEKGLVLTVPLQVSNDYGDLRFFLMDNSPRPACVNGVKFQWSSEPDLMVTNGWGGVIADYDRGFSNCLACGISTFVGSTPVGLPGIRFEKTTNGLVNVKGAAEFTFTGTNFSSTLTFGIQFVSDTNWTAYVTEQPILRNGLSIDFPAPRRP
jgi:hypothetical protein